MKSWYDTHYKLWLCPFCTCVLKPYSNQCKCKRFQKYLHKQGNKVIRDLAKYPDEDYFGFRPGKHHYRRLGIKEQL